MIKAIVFDLWNTLINGSRIINILDKNLEKKLDEINFSPYDFFTFGHYTWMSDGKGVAEKYFEEYCEENNLDKKHVLTLEEYWNTIRKDAKLIKGVPRLVKKLSKNYKLGLLSNTGLAGKEIFETKKIKKYFDVITYSFEEWIVKPNVNLYCRVCRYLEVKPFEAIFIDDIKSFVEGAIYLGMEGILFDGKVKNLKKELKKRGIKV